jgi:hypothetical protein
MGATRLFIVGERRITIRPTAPRPSWPGIAVRRTASLPLAYVPAIHVLLAAKKDVDARDKPGHDEREAES